MNKKCSIYLFKMVDSGIRAQDWLDADETLRFQKMTSEKRRNEFLNSRFLLKSVLMQFHEIKAPKILKKKNGKPFVKGLKFNFSHSENRVALAVHDRYDLGIDLEQSSGKRSYRQIAEQYFSPTECKYIFSSPVDHQIEKFKLIWAFKEAYIKAFDGVLSEKSVQISVDLAKEKIENKPTKKPISFVYNEKNNLALCVVGKIDLTDVEIFDVKLASKGIHKKISKMKMQVLT